MAYASQTTTASGLSNSVTVPFSYIKKGDVHVTLDGVEVSQSLLEWPSTGQITLPSTPDSGVVIKVYRSTDASDLLAVFSNPNVFDSGNLNNALKQLLFVTQEAFDAYSGVQAVVDALNTYVADSLAYITSALASIASSVSAASGYATAAQASADLAAENAASVDPENFATAAQGAKADTAVQPADVGTAAALDVGTTANKIVQLDGAGKLPAVDASQLTGVLTPPDFESAEQAITNSATLTVAHGLGAIPRRFSVVMRCKTAEGQFSVGDELNPLTYFYSPVDSGYHGASAFANATNVKISTATLHLPASSGSFTSATLANWRYVVRAWK